jgi:hypothetical protein
MIFITVKVMHRMYICEVYIEYKHVWKLIEKMF